MTRETSFEAFQYICQSGKVTKTKLEIYRVLFNWGPLTRSEIDARMAHKAYKSHISARLCDMRDMGIVAEKGVRICTVTGLKVIQWDVTSGLPAAVKRKKDKFLCPHCRGTGVVTKQLVLGGTNAATASTDEASGD